MHFDRPHGDLLKKVELPMINAHVLQVYAKLLLWIQTPLNEHSKGVGQASYWLVGFTDSQIVQITLTK